MYLFIIGYVVSTAFFYETILDRPRHKFQAQKGFWFFCCAFALINASAFHHTEATLPPWSNIIAVWLDIAIILVGWGYYISTIYPCRYNDRKLRTGIIAINTLATITFFLVPRYIILFTPIDIDKYLTYTYILLAIQLALLILSLVHMDTDRKYAAK